MALFLTLLQIGLLLGAPWLIVKLSHRFQLKGWLNPVILCYGTGILVGRWPFGEHFTEVATWHRDIFLLLAIPLLLFSTDLGALGLQARSTILSFFACVLSAFVAAVSTALFIFPTAQSPLLAGMLTALYSGGIANLNAVGLALGAPSELLIYANTADILTGGIFLIFLTSGAKSVYGWWLGFENPEEEQAPEVPVSKANWWRKDTWSAFALSVVIAALAAGGTFLLTGALETISVLLLLLTTISVLASLRQEVRAWRGSFELGEYFLLIFCVALGMLANFQNILAEGSQVILFMATVLLITVSLHLLISKLWGIDAITTLIMATAALYGPVFIPQVAAAINDRRLLFAGIAMGLIGYAIGNYLGLGAMLLCTLFE